MQNNRSQTLPGEEVGMETVQVKQLQNVPVRLWKQAGFDMKPIVLSGTRKN